MTKLDIASIAADLAQAPETSAARSQTAQLADLISHIDAALARGVPRRELLERLHQGGFTMSLPVFDNALHRIRKRTGRTSPRRIHNQPAPPQTPRPVQPVAEAPPPPSTDAGIKSLDELAREFPHLPRMQLIKLEAQQYDRPTLTSAALEDLKRKYPQKSKP